MTRFRSTVYDIVDSSPQRLYALTECSYSCVYTSYNLVNTMTNTIEGEKIADSNFSFVGLVHLASKADLVETEVLVYDFYDLIGDIGGFLGLLLGASLMSLVDAVRKKLKREYKKGVFVFGEA